MKNYPLCKDCKWRSGIMCNTPYRRYGIDYVDGGTIELDWHSCVAQRYDGWLMSHIQHTCGKNPRWFEAKDPIN